MPRLRFASLLIAGGLLLLLLSETFAHGHKTRKKARHRQRHMHSHDHGHSHAESHGHDHGAKTDDHGHSHGGHGHSHGGPWSFGGGASMSQSFASGAAAIFSPALMLIQPGHEGHDHSGGGEGGSSGESSTDSGSSGTEFNPTFFGTVGYAVAPQWTSNLNLGFTLNDGLTDPSIGITKAGQYVKRWSIAYSGQATLPVSKASSDSYKITTITSAIRPSYVVGKSSVNLGISMGMTWYSKTVIVEEEEEPAAEEGETLAAPMSLQHDHPHGPGAHGPGIDEFGDATLGTGDREFNRYTLESSYAYRWLKNLSLTAGGAIAYVTHQFGSPTFESTAQIPQVDYGVGNFTISTALTLFGTGSSFTFPTTPGVTAGFLYLHE